MNTELYKQKLLDELARLEDELRSLGRINPANPKDWEATPGDIDTTATDQDEKADAIEEFEERTAVLKDLEIQYNDVKDALARIEQKTYGKCAIGGEDIPHARLEALPTAKTCMEHAAPAIGGNK